MIFWQRRFWHKRIGLSFLQPAAVSTLRVETPIPQLSEHDVHGLADAFRHVALTITIEAPRKKKRGMFLVDWKEVLFVCVVDKNIVKLNYSKKQFSPEKTNI